MEEKLTEKQLAVALEAVFGDSGRTTEEILDEAGVRRETYAEWLRDGDYLEFTRYISALAAEAEGARIIKKLSEEARSGDPKAVKAYIDMLKSTFAKMSPSEDLSDPELESARREVWGDDGI